MKMIPRRSSRRLGTHDEIAKLWCFSHPTTKSYVTGTELFVDGGFAQV